MVGFFKFRKSSTLLGIFYFPTRNYRLPIIFLQPKTDVIGIFYFPTLSSFSNRINSILVNCKLRIGFFHFFPNLNAVGIYYFPTPKSSFSNQINPILVNCKFPVGFSRFFPNLNDIGNSDFPTLNYHFPVTSRDNLGILLFPGRVL